MVVHPGADRAGISEDCNARLTASCSQDVMLSNGKPQVVRAVAAAYRIQPMAGFQKLRVAAGKRPPHDFAKREIEAHRERSNEYGHPDWTPQTRGKTLQDRPVRSVG